MTFIDHDLGPDGPTRAPAKPVTAQRTPAGGQPPLMDLQRLAGNAAVSQALRSGRLDSTVPVQRLEEGYANDEEEAQEAEEQAEQAEEAEAYGESPAGGEEEHGQDEDEEEDEDTGAD